MPVIDLNKIRTEKHWANRFKDGIKKGGYFVKTKVQEGVQFVKENPEATAAILTTGTAAVEGTRRLIIGVERQINKRRERHDRDRRTYDHSLDIWLETKRKMTKKDIDRMNELMRRGYKKSEALSMLKLLKR